MQTRLEPRERGTLDAAPPPAVSLRAVERRFAHRDAAPLLALGGVSAAHHGEILAVAGPSGSGRTTLPGVQACG